MMNWIPGIQLWQNLGGNWIPKTQKQARKPHVIFVYTEDVGGSSPSSPIT